MTDEKSLLPEKIIESARSYLRTPWSHTGRVKAVGVDCYGLIACAFNDIGLKVEDMASYSQSDEYVLLNNYLSKTFVEVEFDQKNAGDVLVFRGAGMWNHIAIYSGGNLMIHTYTNVGCVVEHMLVPHWERMLRKVYRHKDLM